MGWLAGWSHRKTVTITGQAGAGTDYQVNLSIGDASGGDFHLENHCTSFPNDITVTDNDQTTLLDHWVEDLTVDPISMWVEVADDLGSNVDICVYYDKTGESSASNIRNTHIVGDDFDGGTEQWTEVEVGNEFTIDRITNHRINISGYSNTENAYIYLDKGSDVGNVVLQFTANRTDNIGGTGFGCGISDTLNSGYGVNWNDGVVAFFHSNSINTARYITAWTRDEGTTGAMPASYTFTNSVTYYFDLYIYGDVFTLKVYSDAARTNVLLDTNVTNDGVTGLRYVYAIINMGDFDTDASGWITDIRLRKYNDPEPAFSSAGSEESAPVAGIGRLVYGGLINDGLTHGRLVA